MQRRSAIDIDKGLVEALRLSGDCANTHVTCLRNVNEHSGTYRQILERL